MMTSWITSLTCPIFNAPWAALYFKLYPTTIQNYLTPMGIRRCGNIDSQRDIEDHMFCDKFWSLKRGMLRVLRVVVLRVAYLGSIWKLNYAQKKMKLFSPSLTPPPKNNRRKKNRLKQSIWRGGGIHLKVYCSFLEKRPVCPVKFPGGRKIPLALFPMHGTVGSMAKCIHDFVLRHKKHNYETVEYIRMKRGPDHILFIW